MVEWPGWPPAGTGPVLTTTSMGISALIIGTVIDPVAGLIPLFGMGCLMAAVFLGYFWRDPDRPIPRTAGVLVSPADGHVMFLRRERATGRRPSRSEAESGQLEVDAITGDWYPEPLSDPLSFATEQRFEPVPEGEEHNTDVWRLAVFMSRLTCTSTGHPQPVLLNGLNIARERGYAVDRFVRLTPKKANTTSAFVQFTNSRTVIESSSFRYPVRWQGPFFPTCSTVMPFGAANASA